MVIKSENEMLRENMENMEVRMRNNEEMVDIYKGRKEETDVLI